MGLADLTLAKIKGACTTRSYERGVDCYRSGRVMSVRLVGNAVKAVVEGSDDYGVEIAWPGRRGGGRARCSCSCPYSYGGECKHVVAVLLHVKDHSAAMAREAEKSASSIKGMLDGAGERHLREFLADEMAGDPGLAERFARGAGGPPVAGLDYYGMVSSMFRAEADSWRRGGIDGDDDGDDDSRVDLEGVMKAAAGFEARGDAAEASRIYGQIASAVSAHIGEADGAEEHGAAARAAIAKWASCLAESRPTEADRRAAISAAFAGYRGDDRFSGDYESAVWSLCRSAGDLAHVLDLVGPHMPDPVPADGGGAGARRGAGRRLGGKSPPRRRRRDYIECESPGRMRMLRIQVKALEKLGRKRDIDRLLEAHARADPAACALRVMRLAGSGAKSRAARAAAEGLDLFGHEGSIAAAALSVYGKDEPGRVSVLSGLFTRTLDWSYYDQLRMLPGWPRERAAVLARMARDKKGAGMLIEMLVREGMHEKALREIAARGDVAVFERYIEPVSAGRPRAYLAAYGRCVAGFADRAGTGWQYMRVGLHLERMAGIAGGREVAAGLAAAISAKYPRKRGLLKVLAPIAGQAGGRARARAGWRARARPR